jgi:nucleoside-diphosphate-sugar epimerase
VIVVTGATGFTGEHVVRALGGTPFRAMVRDASKVGDVLRRPNVTIVRGDFNDRESMVQAFQGCDTLINVGSLGFGHGPEVVEAAEQAGIRRAVFISTTAIFTTLEARTKAIRLAAEEAIRGSGLAWTILRPTMIYGTDRDRNIFRVVRSLKRVPVFPVFGDGNHLQQPIHVEDLALAIVRASKSDRTVGKAYNLPGQSPLSFNDLIRTVGKALNKRVVLIHVPQQFLLPVLALYNRMSRRPLLKVEQVLRLNEDKAFSYEEAVRDFGFAPRSFEQGVFAMVRALSSQSSTPAN